jgi:hypothetical protein
MEEALFAPCTRMQDLIRAWNDHFHDNPGNTNAFLFRDFDFEEVELRAGAGNGAGDIFYHTDFTFDDLWDPTRSKIVWITLAIFVLAIANRHANNNNNPKVCHERFGYGPALFSVRQATSLETGRYNELHIMCSRSVVMDTTRTTICNYIFQLMTRSSTICTHLGITSLPSVSTDTLSRFLNNSCSSGGTIRFEKDCLSRLSQDQLRVYLRVFEDSTGPHHRVELNIGGNWSQLQSVAIAELLQRCQCAFVLRCQGLTVRRRGTIPSFIFDALRGDCNIVELRLVLVSYIDGLARVLAENKSLVRLNFYVVRISDDDWTVLCQSLSRHPKLEFLGLVSTLPHGPDQHSNERKTRRTNVFLKIHCATRARRS